MSYTVQRGDSWSRIAGILYGDQRMFQALMAANPGISGLQPGMVLNTPPRQENPLVTINPADIQVEGIGGVNPYSQEGQYLLGQGAAPSPAQSLTAQILGTGQGAATPKGKGPSRGVFTSLFPAASAVKPPSLQEMPGAVADLYGNLFGNLFGQAGKTPGPPQPYQPAAALPWMGRTTRGGPSGVSDETYMAPRGALKVNASQFLTDLMSGRLTTAAGQPMVLPGKTRAPVAGARPEPTQSRGAPLFKALGMPFAEGARTFAATLTDPVSMLLERAHTGVEGLLRMAGAGYTGTWALARARDMWRNGDPAAGITPEMVHERYGSWEAFSNEVLRQAMQQPQAGGALSLIDQGQPGAGGATVAGMTPEQLRTWAARYTAQTVQQYLTPGSVTYGDRDRGLPDVIGTDVANQVADWYIRRFGGELVPGGDPDARAAVLTNLGYSYDPNATGGLGDMGAWIKDTWTRPYSGSYAFGREPRDGYGYDSGSFPRQYSREPSLFSWNIRIT